MPSALESAMERVATFEERLWERTQSWIDDKQTAEEGANAGHQVSEWTSWAWRRATTVAERAKGLVRRDDGPSLPN